MKKLETETNPQAPDDVALICRFCKSTFFVPANLDSHEMGCAGQEDRNRFAGAYSVTDSASPSTSRDPWRSPQDVRDWGAHLSGRPGSGWRPPDYA